MKHDADGTLKDNNGRLPYECIPESKSESKRSCWNYVHILPPPPPSLVVVGKEQVEIAEQLRELLKAAAENPPQRSRSKQVSSLTKLTPGPPSEPPTPPTVTPSHKARNPALRTGSSPTPERRSPVPREAGKSKYYSEYFRSRVVVVRLHNVQCSISYCV